MILKYPGKPATRRADFTSRPSRTGRFLFLSTSSCAKRIYAMDVESMRPTPPASTPSREPDQSEGITDEHRNGSITAIGIVLGFSLTFLSSWMHGPEPWDYIGIVILVTLASGIALQILSLSRLLILPRTPGLRHTLTDHNRAVALFLWGTALVS